MGYCSQWDRSTPHISGGDVTGAHAAYGAKPNHLTNQVLIYSSKGYAGGVAALYPGSYSSFSGLDIGNDSASSIRVPNGWSVTLYENTNYGGSSVTLTGDVFDLGGNSFNEKASSMVVTGPSGSFPVIYKDANYAGTSQTLRPGLYTSGELAFGNDAASSLTVPTGWKVTLYEDGSFSGTTVTYTASASSFVNFDNKTSCVRVEGPDGWNPVMLFNDASYKGSAQALWPGRYAGISNDALSSLIIPSGWRVTLLEHGDYWGDRLQLTSSQASLSPWGWNDVASSIVIEGPQRSWYTLQAKHSGKYVDVAGVTTADGALLHQWSWTGANNQKFDLVPTSDGYYNIVSKHSSKCMGVSAGSTSDGTNVIQWPCNGGDDQKFSIQTGSDGYSTVIAKHSSKCLDVSQYSSSDGAHVLQWTCTGNDNQKFQLAAASL
jgi:hypothetical protein